MKAGKGDTIGETPMDAKNKKKRLFLERVFEDNILEPCFERKKHPNK